MLNLSPLFFAPNSRISSFHTALELRSEHREELLDARREIRTCLREGIPKILKRTGYEGEVPSPRFFTQGSWAYKTLNEPARPPQQADLDDGCYLPMSFLEPTHQPRTKAIVFYKAAEAALQPLVAERGWELDLSKSTCVRVLVSEVAHIDIPLYAIPDDEYGELVKTASHRSARSSVEDALLHWEQEAWMALPTDRVLLAHRDKSWIPSDPRPLKIWFLGEVEAKGEQLRRIIRYLKAFRDWKWDEGGPSSVLIMAATASIYRGDSKDRDDLAFLQVLADLPQRLRNGVVNPKDLSESFTDRLGPSGVLQAASAFEQFEVVLRSAIYQQEASSACHSLRNELGPRFPNMPSWAKKVDTRSAILATSPSVGPSELIGRTRAG